MLETGLTLIIAFGVLVAVGVIFQKVGHRKRSPSRPDHKHGLEGLGLAFVIVAVALSLVSLIVWSAVAVSSRNTISKMEAFHRDTLSTYEYTVTETERIIIDVNQGEITDFADGAAPQRLVELRDAVAWYNQKYRKYQSWEDVFVIGGMMKSIPEDLKPISIGP